MSDCDPFQLRKLIVVIDDDKTMTAGKRSFYRRQNELINELLQQPDHKDPDEEAKLLKLKIAIYGSAVANVVLFALQLVASISSGSLALLATSADAFVDITSSSVLILVHRAQISSNPFKYPIGRSKLESTGVVIFATLMAVLSIQLVIESIKKIIIFGNENVTSSSSNVIKLDALSISCIAVAIGTKLCLGLYCLALKQFPSAKVLAQDHLNDILLNGSGILFSLLAQHVVWWIDPMGAILLALYLFVSWLKTAKEHVKLTVGRSADPHVLQKLTYVTLLHDERIRGIDTCKAYHFGINYFVEVDIVLPAEMHLREAHDIGESLQQKLESISFVERAFVHLDYESTHKPEH